jgi:hypothetical protein
MYDSFVMSTESDEGGKGRITGPGQSLSAHGGGDYGKDNSETRENADFALHLNRSMM